MNIQEVLFVTMGSIFGLILIGFLIWAIYGIIEQKKDIDAANYRKTYGEFDENQYTTKASPLKVSRKQENKGDAPEVFNKEIKFINLFDFDI